MVNNSEADASPSEQQEIAWLRARLEHEVARREMANAALDVAQTRLRDIVLLSAVAIAANEAPSLATAAPVCLELFARRIRARAATLWVRDEHLATFLPTGYWYIDGPRLEELATVVEDTFASHQPTLVDRVALTGRPWVVSLAEAGLSTGVPVDLRQWAIVGIPACSGGVTVGVVGLLMPDGSSLDPATLDVVGQAASQLAAVVDRSGSSRQVAHEVRTPLHGILGTLELLLAGPLDAEARELAEAALESAITLHHSIQSRLAVLAEDRAQPGSMR